MVKLNYSRLRDILKVLYFTPGIGGRWGLPAIFYGDPGIGKTSMIAAEARAMGLCEETLIGATTDPTDFNGYPSAPADGSDFARMLLPQWTKGVAAWPGGRGVLTLDELTCVPAAQQAAMLRLVLEGAIGTHKLDPHVRIVAAANPPEQAAGGQSLSMPMANRFGHFAVEPAGMDDWFAILRGEFQTDAVTIDGEVVLERRTLDAAALEAEVMAQWDGEYRRALAMVQGFLLKRPECAQRTPKVGSPDAEGAWTSRRSWEMAARAMAGARIHGLDADCRDTLLAGFIGHATALEFVGWLREADLPDEIAVLDGREEWHPVTYRPDRTQAVIKLCEVALFKTTDQALRISRARRFWKVLEEIARETPDLAEPSIKVMWHDRAIGSLPEGTETKRLIMEVGRAIGTGSLRAR